MRVYERGKKEGLGSAKWGSQGTKLLQFVINLFLDNLQCFEAPACIAILFLYQITFEGGQTKCI